MKAHLNHWLSLEHIPCTWNFPYVYKEEPADPILTEFYLISMPSEGHSNTDLYGTLYLLGVTHTGAHRPMPTGEFPARTVPSDMAVKSREELKEELWASW